MTQEFYLLSLSALFHTRTIFAGHFSVRPCSSYLQLLNFAAQNCWFSIQIPYIHWRDTRHNGHFYL